MLTSTLTPRLVAPNVSSVMLLIVPTYQTRQGLPAACSLFYETPTEAAHRVFGRGTDAIYRPAPGVVNTRPVIGFINYASEWCPVVQVSGVQKPIPPNPFYVWNTYAPQDRDIRRVLGRDVVICNTAYALQKAQEDGLLFMGYATYTEGNGAGRCQALFVPRSLPTPPVLQTKFSKDDPATGGRFQFNVTVRPPHGMIDATPEGIALLLELAAEGANVRQERAELHGDEAKAGAFSNLADGATIAAADLIQWIHATKPTGGRA